MCVSVATKVLLLKDLLSVTNPIAYQHKISNDKEQKILVAEWLMQWCFPILKFHSFNNKNTRSQIFISNKGEKQVRVIKIIKNRQQIN